MTPEILNTVNDYIKALERRDIAYAVDNTDLAFDIEEELRDLGSDMANAIINHFTQEEEEND